MGLVSHLFLLDPTSISKSSVNHDNVIMKLSVSILPPPGLSYNFILFLVLI